MDSVLKDIENKEEVIKIELEVGQLAGIEGEHLKEHLEDRVDWKIRVVEKEARVKCRCGHKGKPKIEQRMHDLVLFSCPQCGETPKIEEGDKIKIKSVTYE